MQNKYITQEEMSKKIDLNVRTIQRNIKKLQTENIVERIGSNKDGYWTLVE
ncbi:MAG: HTH domain-containing protein [Tissierellia bacterium]|jgi:predicted HTH transcriptional regulator|nr:HTH domain-containing protein [Tissierellia bacterium]